MVPACACTSLSKHFGKHWEYPAQSTPAFQGDEGVGRPSAITSLLKKTANPDHRGGKKGRAGGERKSQVPQQIPTFPHPLFHSQSSRSEWICDLRAASGKLKPWKNDPCAQVHTSLMPSLVRPSLGFESQSIHSNQHRQLSRKNSANMPCGMSRKHLLRWTILIVADTAAWLSMNPQKIAALKELRL